MNPLIDKLILPRSSGCCGRNGLSDEIFALLSRRSRDNDTSAMDFTVTKTVTAQYVISGASNPEEAIERAQKGEGQRSQSGQTWNAIVRPPQGIPPNLGSVTRP